MSSYVVKLLKRFENARGHNVVTILLLLLSSTSAFSQIKKVDFFGYALMQYQRPARLGDGSYRAYYQNLGEKFAKGRFELNEAQAKFTVKWENGEDWIMKYKTKTTLKNHEDINLGLVTKVTYTGMFENSDTQCEFRLLQNNENNCVVELRIAKVVDNDKKIDAWKKVFRFYLNSCFSNVAEPPKKLTNNLNDFPFFIDQSTYDNILLRDEEYEIISSPSQVEKILTPQNRNYLMSLEKNQTKEMGPIAKIKEIDTKFFHVTFWAYIKSEKDYDHHILTFASITKKESKILIDQKLISEYVVKKTQSNSIKCKLVTVELDKNGRMEVNSLRGNSKSYDEPSTTKYFQINQNGYIKELLK